MVYWDYVSVPLLDRIERVKTLRYYCTIATPMHRIARVWSLSIICNEPLTEGYFNTQFKYSERCAF